MLLPLTKSPVAIIFQPLPLSVPLPERLYRALEGFEHEVLAQSERSANYRGKSPPFVWLLRGVREGGRESFPRTLPI